MVSAVMAAGSAAHLAASPRGRVALVAARGDVTWVCGPRGTPAVSLVFLIGGLLTEEFDIVSTVARQQTADLNPRKGTKSGRDIHEG